jgi:hypothetical protein
VLTLGSSTRTFLATTTVLNAFTAWNHQHHQDPNSAAVTYNQATRTHTVDLTRLVQFPLTCPAAVTEQHLDALQSLLFVMHRRGDNNSQDNGIVLGVDELWRLGGLKDALGLEKRWVDFLRGCMQQFVGGIKNVGGWLNLDGLEEVGEDEEAVIGESETMERAVNTCLVFGWWDELRVVAARLAYVCGVGKSEGEGAGEKVLVKPGGRRLEVGVCGREVVGEYPLSGRGDGRADCG